jgi:asparagine synthase (glutamine-hydrolysing)
MMYAARDRFGEKPFYYSFDDGQLIFASEMKALWEAGVAKEPNNSMLYNYITLGYTTNPFDSNETFYTKVQKLPAASFLTYSLASQQLVIEKYWQVDSIEKEGLRDEDVVHEFNERLSSSIQKRLRSDVAIGTSLSGGLDSSAIVGFCSRITNEQYVHQCFTAVFPGYEKSEEQYASIVAKQFHLQHHLVQVTEEDLAGNMDALMWHHEEPVGSSSILAQYKVYEAAKQNGITVLLDGQGADELLAGYHKYYKWYWQQLYAERRLKSSGELAAAHSLGIKESFGLKNKAMALLPHFSMAMLQSKKAKEAFKHPDLNKEFAFLQKRNSYYTTPTESTLNSALFYNSFVNGLEELLRYADRNSMAHSVEVRLPFLQHQLVEFLFSLPPHFKIRNGWTKWLLRKATEQTLPSSIVWRKDKVGFEPPQKQWMLHHKVQEHIQASKELLVKNDILSAAVLSKPIKPSDAGDAINSDWRYWSASYLFR